MTVSRRLIILYFYDINYILNDIDATFFVFFYINVLLKKAGAFSILSLSRTKILIKTFVFLKRKAIV